jgi:hypothetical protein
VRDPTFEPRDEPGPLRDDSEGVTYDEWERARLKLLPKKGDLTLCKNWRGICLLDAASKIFSSILVARMQKVMKLHGRRSRGRGRRHSGRRSRGRRHRGELSRERGRRRRGRRSREEETCRAVASAEGETSCVVVSVVRIRVVVGGIMCRDFHSLGRGEGEACRAVACVEGETSCVVVSVGRIRV